MAEVWVWEAPETPHKFENVVKATGADKWVDLVFREWQRGECEKRPTPLPNLNIHPKLLELIKDYSSCLKSVWGVCARSARDHSQVWIYIQCCWSWWGNCPCLKRVAEVCVSEAPETTPKFGNVVEATEADKWVALVFREWQRGECEKRPRPLRRLKSKVRRYFID